MIYKLVYIMILDNEEKSSACLFSIWDIDRISVHLDIAIDTDRDIADDEVVLEIMIRRYQQR